MSLGLTRKSLFPPTGMCFFMRLKLLKRHSSSPLLFTLRLKSTSAQLYLKHNRTLRPWTNHQICDWLTSANLPIKVILNILRQVHIEHDKVVEVTPAEGLAGRLTSQAAAPPACTAHCIQGDVRCGFHMLQHRLQRHVGPIWCLTERGKRGQDKQHSLRITSLFL